MNRVHLKTYGCQMNERDSEAVAAMLRTRGYSIVETEDEADVVLLNTCAVRDQAEQKAIGKALQLTGRKRRNPKMLVGILGCMAQNHGKDLLDRLPELDLLVGTQKFHRVPDHLDHLMASQRGLGPKPAALVDLGAEEGSQNTIRDHDAEGFQPTAFVSIMQGCNMNCAFCIVPKTRGPERCRSIADIVAECRELASRGTREVTLLGQIVNSYGRREIPFRGGISPFVQLIEAVSEIEGIERIRFTSPHPRGFKDDLVEAYGRLPKLMPCVHLPMQSGSDRILKVMNRPYSAERYQRIMDALRAVNPDMNFTTDIIVGFPGETDEDFEQTRQLVERNRFDMAFIFKYSVRTGTAAEPLGDPVPSDVKDARNQILLDTVGASSLARHQSLIGTVQQVLVEGPAKRGENIFMGRNPGYRKVLFPATPRLVGQIVPVRIESATITTVMGRLELAGVDEPQPATLAHSQITNGDLPHPATDNHHSHFSYST